MTSKEIHKRKFSGIVTSDKMHQTIVVKVQRMKMNSKYQKRYTVSKKFKVHDPRNTFHRGDRVEFVECRPISKEKRWRVLYPLS